MGYGKRVCERVRISGVHITWIGGVNFPLKELRQEEVYMQMPVKEYRNISLRIETVIFSINIPAVFSLRLQLSFKIFNSQI